MIEAQGANLTEQLPMTPFGFILNAGSDKGNVF
jgi:hypothetical protein